MRSVSRNESVAHLVSKLEHDLAYHEPVDVGFHREERGSDLRERNCGAMAGVGEAKIARTCEKHLLTGKEPQLIIKNAPFGFA